MVDESQGSAKKKMLTQWMRHQQLMRNDPMQKKKRWGGDQGMHGPKKKFEDGSSLPHVGPAAFRRIKKRLV